VAAQRQEELGRQLARSWAAKPVATATVAGAGPVKIDPITDRLRVRGVAGLMCEIDKARAAARIYGQLGATEGLDRRQIARKRGPCGLSAMPR
jgi:hypothetical protein